MDWSRFIPSDFEYDWEKNKLVKHGVSLGEAVETFFNDYGVRRNKRFRDRYQLIGRTNGGRRLKIVFQLKPRKVVRIQDGQYEEKKTHRRKDRRDRHERSR